MANVYKALKPLMDWAADEQKALERRAGEIGQERRRTRVPAHLAELIAALPDLELARLEQDLKQRVEKLRK